MAFKYIEESGPFKFSSTVCVDPLRDDSEDLIEIARGKFKVGASVLPNAIKYQSVHCNVSQLILKILKCQILG